MRFKDIPQFTREGSYKVNVNWKYLREWVESNKTELNLQMNPIFQRGHVWTKEQQIAYVEFILRGGKSSRDVYFNCPGWHWEVKSGEYNDFVCVDGLQRITAVLAFMDNQIPAFGAYLNEYEDRVPMDADLVIHINDLKSEAEVLQWYLDLNTGGTPHTDDEIKRVQRLLGVAKGDVPRVCNKIEHGSIVYWARQYGRVVCKCQVIAINETENRVVSFIVKMLDDNYAHDAEVRLKGSTLGDVVFVDENLAKKRLEEFGEGDQNE